MAILAIDQGTSGTRALIVGSDGAVLSKGYAPVELVYLAAGVRDSNADLIMRPVVYLTLAGLQSGGICFSVLVAF